nr:protein ripply1 isoform X2 [Saimiri boliviensis boliviensis]
MDSPACAASATPVPALALALAPAPAQAPLALPGLLSASPLLSSGQEVDGSERGACLWRPWLSSTNDSLRQMRKLVDLAASGTTAAEVTKAESKFHHPVRQPSTYMRTQTAKMKKRMKRRRRSRRLMKRSQKGV